MICQFISNKAKFRIYQISKTDVSNAKFRFYLDVLSLIYSCPICRKTAKSSDIRSTDNLSPFSAFAGRQTNMMTINNADLSIIFIGFLFA